MMPDWFQLPEELLGIVSVKLKNCFDVVHARSVCSSWRSAFPFPACLLRQTYSLPSIPFGNGGLCTVEKFSLFFFRVHTLPVAAVSPSEFFLGGIVREDHMELPSPVQCSVKVKMQESGPTLMNMLDCQILPLGHQYRMLGWNPKEYATEYRGVAFLPLNKEGREEIVVLLNYSNKLLALKSSEMKWKWLKNIPDSHCRNLVTFRGRFYANFWHGEIVVIDPYSLDVTPMMTPQPLSTAYLVRSGDDELFLFEVIFRRGCLTCRVSRLNDEAGKWVVVSDLGDRMLFVGDFGNVSCSTKELPDGCGIRNSILTTSGNVIFIHKYGLCIGSAEKDLGSGWRLSTDYCATLHKTSPVVAFRVERRVKNLTLLT